MKKHGLILALSFFAWAASGATKEPHVYECTFYKRIAESIGGKMIEETYEKELLPLTRMAKVERTYHGYRVHVFVCNSDPVSEVDVFVDGPRGERTVAIGHVKDENDAYIPSLYSDVPLEDGRSMMVSVWCAKQS